MYFASDDCDATVLCVVLVTAVTDLFPMRFLCRPGRHAIYCVPAVTDLFCVSHVAQVAWTIAAGGAVNTERLINTRTWPEKAAPFDRPLFHAPLSFGYTHCANIATTVHRILRPACYANNNIHCRMLSSCCDGRLHKQLFAVRNTCSSPSDYLRLLHKH